MIRIKNIYYMLAYAFKVLNNSGYANMTFESFENVQDLLSAILVKGVNNQVKKGINKNYISDEDVLKSPKGKILISQSIKSNAFQNKKIYCAFDEFSENTYLNQILKSTMLLLSKSDQVKKEQKKSLQKTLIFFQNTNVIPLSFVKWNNLSFQRNNATYKMLINICYFAYQEFIFSEDDSGKKIEKPIDDQRMHRLYEKFILAYYQKHFPELSPKASYIDWNTDDGIIELLPTMKSDITLSTNGKTLIIDSKYYAHTLQKNSLYDTKTIHSNNLYQIFAYVKNKDISSNGSVSGMLLYAKTDEEITPDHDYKISGNTISVKTLDLNQPFQNISHQLNEIVNQWLAK